MMPDMGRARKITRLLAYLALAHLFQISAGLAAQLDPARGPVVLTVSGDIANWNRGAFDETRDGFFKYHDIKFDKAMQFDRSMLANLAQGKVTAKPPQLKKSGTFSGPTFAALLEAVGVAKTAKVRVLALDGFAVEIDAVSIEEKDWILATSVDGKPLSIGDQGPVWLLHTPGAAKSDVEREEQSWPWAVFYMSVE